jgi:epoxyqueuosine reductase
VFTQTEHTRIVKEIASQLGFAHCGISKAEFLEDEAPRLEQWLKQNMHGEMRYMENYFDKRLDPTLLVPGAKSVVSLMFNYYPKEIQDAALPKISKYALGEDYHVVVKDKLFQFVELIRERIGEVGGRVFVDSAPVLEKAWAAKSGLGWVGKNSNLISKQKGSFFFLAELILDLNLDADTLVTDHCGTCTACIDACPTGAIVGDRIVDGSKCISYFTIELKENVPNEWKEKLDGWAFGCDVCQDVCPWNRFSIQHNEPRFFVEPERLNLSKNEWKEMTAETFQAVFGKTPLMRAGLAHIQSTIAD